jgi:hypothetical protein
MTSGVMSSRGRFLSTTFEGNAGSVVVTAGQYPNLVVENLVNESMLLINASGPAAPQFVF